MTRIFLLFILIGVFFSSNSGPANAFDYFDSRGLDPTVIFPGLPDCPCSSADIILEISAITSEKAQGDPSDALGTGSWTFDIMNGGTAIAHVKSYYRRVNGSNNHVEIEDKIIVPGTMTIFGKAFNQSANISGTRGVITRVIDDSGKLIDLKGTYMYSTWHGTTCMCIWLK